MSIRTVTEFFAWSLLINVGVLLLTTSAIMLMRGWMKKIHCAMFGLSSGELAREYFRYLASYKLLIIFFNLVPYIALRVIA